MKTITDKDTQPVIVGAFAPDSWERALDPWHRDAFPDEFKDAAPNQQDKRREGWMGYDWCGNPIIFVPDGTEIGGNTSATFGLYVVKAEQKGQ